MEAADPAVSAAQQRGGVGAGQREPLVQRLRGRREEDQPREPDADAGSDGRARPGHRRPGGVWSPAGPVTSLQAGL